MTSPLSFPEVIDSTMLSAFASCERRFWWAYMRHRAPEGENIHLHAGACYARGLEVARRSYYDKGEPEDEAIISGAQALLAAWGTTQAPEGSSKSIDRVLSAYTYYFNQWPLAHDYIIPFKTPSGSALEFNFCLPLPNAKHPQTGQPILYAGRFDMLGVREGALFGLDDKTTTSLGASWSKQWQLRGQFTGYSWGAREFAYRLAGFLVRGVSILKAGHDHQEAIIHRPDWMIDQWLAKTHRLLDQMIESWRTDYWAQNFDTACHQFGPCAYMLLCDTPDPEPFVPIYYKDHVWNPLVRSIEVPSKESKNSSSAAQGPERRSA